MWSLCLYAAQTIAAHLFRHNKYPETSAAKITKLYNKGKPRPQHMILAPFKVNTLSCEADADKGKPSGPAETQISQGVATSTGITITITTGA